MAGRLVNRAFLILAVSVLPAVGCVTTNQLQNFLRTEIAIIGAQILADPIESSLAELVGPEIIVEVVPSL